MSKQIREIYTERFTREYGSIDLSRYCIHQCGSLGELGNVPVTEIFVPFEFIEYDPVNQRHQRGKKFTEMVVDDDNRVILADVGGSKTTFLKFLLYKKIEEGIVPVYWEWDKLFNRASTGVDFSEIVYDYVYERLKDTFEPEVIKSFIKENRFVYMIDKFDKIPIANSRPIIENIIEVSRNKNRSKANGDYFIIASRITDFPREYFDFFKTREFSHFRIKSLSDELILDYVERYINYIPAPPEFKTQEQIVNLADEIRAQSSIKKLAENPFLLNLIISLYLRTGTLPPTKIDLYDNCIEMLLGEWKKSYTDIRIFEEKLFLDDTSLNKLMIETAYEFYHRFINEKDDQNNFGEMPRHELKIVLTRIYKELISDGMLVIEELSELDGVGDEEVTDAIDELFAYFKRSEKGIIIEKPNGKFGFSHLTLLEYMIARCLEKNYSSFSDCVEFIVDILENPNFERIEETIIFLIILLGISTKKRFVDVLANKLLYLYKEEEGDKKRKILVLLAKLLIDSERFSLECTGEILNSLAIYKSTFVGSREISTGIEEINDVIKNIYKFSKTVKEEFVYLVKKMQEDKKTWKNFSDKAIDWTGKKATKIKNDFVSIEERKENINTEVKNIKKQLELLEKIMDSYEELATEGEIQYEQYNLNSMMREIVDSLKQNNDFRSADFEYRSSLDENIVTIDREKVVRILEELTRNSFKHSCPGNQDKKITIELKPDENNQEKFLIYFNDNGNGIPIEQKTKIFDPFFTGDDDSYGLGLVKVKKLVDTLGGEIKEVGKCKEGVSFKISLLMS